LILSYPIEKSQLASAAESIFPLQRNFYHGPPVDYDWAYRGYGSIRITKIGNVPECEIKPFLEGFYFYSYFF